MATHSSVLAWRIPGTGEPGRLPSMGLHRVGHDFTFTFTFRFHALEKEMATHSSVLAWRIPGTGEPGGLPSMGSAKSRTRLKRLSSSSNIHNYQGAPLSAPTYVTLHFQDYISPDTNTTAEFSHSCLPHTHFMLCPS